jgi:CubicO group peptidase (beta-lactamase class C family)
MTSAKLLLLIILLPNIVLLAQDQKPDFGKQFIKAINSVSEQEQRALIHEIFSPVALADPGIERLVEFTKRMQSNFAPLEYHHSDMVTFEKPAGTVYVMHIFCRKKGAQMWTDIQFYLDPNSPHKLQKVAFVAEVTEPIHLPNGNIDEGETLEWLSHYSDKLNSDYDLYGSFLITKGNKVLYEKFYGYEDEEKQRTLSNKTLFNIASGGKMFTAVAIAQLVENGRLSYEDKITKYLSDFRDSTKANKIAIHHLLSHTSGINEYWSGQNDKAVYSATSTPDHMKLVYQAGFSFEPGERYQYCNSNFIALGAIIEQITGKSFYDYVQENIFNRVGMQSTGYFHHGSKDLAIPLARSKDGKGWVEAIHGIRGSSAGGAYSNSADMLKFAKGLRNNALISRESLTLLTSSKTAGLEATEEYGYGFIINQTPGGVTSYGHGGTTGGVNFEFRYYTKQDITLIIFCNQNNGAYDDLKKAMIKLITGQR